MAGSPVGAVRMPGNWLGWGPLRIPEGRGFGLPREVTAGSGVRRTSRLCLSRPGVCSCYPAAPRVHRGLFTRGLSPRSHRGRGNGWTVGRPLSRALVLGSERPPSSSVTPGWSSGKKQGPRSRGLFRDLLVGARTRARRGCLCPLVPEWTAAERESLLQKPQAPSLTRCSPEPQTPRAAAATGMLGG